LPEFRPIGSELPLFENRNDFLLYHAIVSDRSDPVDVVNDEDYETIDLTNDDSVDMSDDRSAELTNHNSIGLNNDNIIDLTNDDDD